RPIAVGRLVHHSAELVGHEGVGPIRDRTFVAVASELGVALAHHTKSILVEAHPQVEPVLFDAIRRSSPGCALPAQAPALLVERDLVAALVVGTRQLERSRHPSASPTDHGHTNSTLRTHTDLVLDHAR